MSPSMNPETTRIDDVPYRQVVLSDGASWGLARPTIRLRPRFLPPRELTSRGNESIIIDRSVSYPPGVEGLIDTFLASLREKPAKSQYAAFVCLASALLRVVHDIPASTARELLDVRNDELQRVIHAVFALIEEAGPRRRFLSKGTFE